MIIGLKGKKGSGKDTVAAYLIKEHGFERRALADPLKKMTAALLNIPYHEIDKWKNNPMIQVEVSEYSSLTDIENREKGGGFFAFINSALSFREFLQRLGDEATQPIWGENVWNDLVLPLDGYYHGKNIVITDCRFEGNARRVNICGGFVVQIRRPGHESQDQHRGEQFFPPKMVDWELINSGTIKKLYDSIELMLEDLGSVETRIGKVLDGNR